MRSFLRAIDNIYRVVRVIGSPFWHVSKFVVFAIFPERRLGKRFQDSLVDDLALCLFALFALGLAIAPLSSVPPLVPKMIALGILGLLLLVTLRRVHTKVLQLHSRNAKCLAKERISVEPPRSARFLINAVPPKKRNELLGHYYETGEYDQWLKKYGQKWADRLFWFRVSCLCLHLLVGVLTSSLVKRFIGK